jgi:hypothetical protein
MSVIEQYDATTVIYPEWDARIDKIGAIEVELRG